MAKPESEATDEPSLGRRSPRIGIRMNALVRRPTTARCATLASLVLSSAALFAGCGDSSTSAGVAPDGGTDSAAVPEASVGAPDARGAAVDAATVVTPADTGAPSAAITVSGHVVAYPTNVPLKSRHVTLLDATGRRVDLTTDANGALEAKGVLPPYDALVDGSTLSPQPKIYVGVSTPRPRLTGWSDVAGDPWRRATVNVQVAAPACGTAQCNYSIVFSDAQGALSTVTGGIAGSYPAGYAPTGPDAFSVQWLGSATARVTARYLVTDATYSHYWYGELANIAVSDAGTTSAGDLSAAPTPPSVPPVSRWTVQPCPRRGDSQT
jgi:hypothetical protein